MELTTAYANTAPSIPTLFEGIQKAAVPDRFTHDIVRGLGLKSSNDRMLINVLKGLGFIDANAVPTQYYRAYKDRTNAGQVLAQQIRKAYKGLFDLASPGKIGEEDARGDTPRLEYPRLTSIRLIR